MVATTKYQKRTKSNKRIGFADTLHLRPIRHSKLLRQLIKIRESKFPWIRLVRDGEIDDIVYYEVAVSGPSDIVPPSMSLDNYAL